MVYAQERDREDVKEKRKQWLEQQPQMNSNSLVFLDESKMNTDFTHLCGRGKGKSRVWDKTPLNTPKSTTLLSSVRLDGEMICGYFQGPLTGDIFCSYVQEHLVPHLRKGDIVVMDNLPTHKVSGVREAIEAAGASVLYLPPYSPDFNPIEMLWSKLKSVLRKVKARSLSALDAAVPLAFASISLPDIAAWFSFAGYSLS